MLEAKMSNMVAQRVEEVVVAIMSRSEQCGCFSNQVLIVGLEFRRHLQRGFTVSGNIHFSSRSHRGRSEANHPEILPADYRRVDKRVERCGLELNRVSGFKCYGERGAVLPAFRKLQCGAICDFIGCIAGRVEQSPVPTH